MKAFIFDMDGVIVFTDKFHYQAWKKMANGMGIYFDEIINNRLRGVSRAESLEIILEKCDQKLTDEKKAELMEEKNNTYRELLKTMTPADVTDTVRDTVQAVARGEDVNAKTIGRDLLRNTLMAGAQAAGGSGKNGIAGAPNNIKPDPDVAGFRSVIYACNATNTDQYERVGTQSDYAGLFREQSFRGKDENTSIIVYYETVSKHHL